MSEWHLYCTHGGHNRFHTRRFRYETYWYVPVSTGLSIENAFSSDALRVITAPELLTFKPPAWVVKPFIELGARGIIYGPSDIGKTFLCLDMALSIATGRPWCGFKTIHAPVAYICAEGSRALGRRVQGWLQYHNKTVADITDTFHTIGSPVQLVRESQRNELLKALMDASPAAPALIIVDTLSWCGLGMDENDSGAMTQLIGGAALLQRAIAAADTRIEPAVLFVHHTGKSKKGMRGAYSLTAATDFVFSYSREKDAVLSKLITERVKDGPKSKPLSFEAVEIVLGVDEDGANITTCVTIPVGYTDERTGKVGELTQNERKVLEALTSADAPLTWAELEKLTGLHPQSLSRALKGVSDEKHLVKRGKGGVYSHDSHGTNSTVSELPNHLLSALTHTHPPSLEGGGESARGVRGGGQGKTKPIVLGTPVRFAMFDPSGFDHEAEEE